LRVLRKKLELLEGDRDKERRSWRMAELASTWWMPECDGRWRVPPDSRCGEKVATMMAKLGNAQPCRATIPE
jgi:hypothetical protein